MNYSGPERRRFKRMEAQLVGGLTQTRKSTEESTLITVNISQGGIYCDTTQYIEPYTIVQVRLVLQKGDGKEKLQREINCEGIVVRCEKKKGSSKFPYSVAIHFLDMSSNDRNFIKELIQEKERKIEGAEKKEKI
ncbi:MAG: PilZ domain-containing protein [bacterium]